MSYKHLLSLSLFTLILPACGDTQDEKSLKRRNDELSRQNIELTQQKDQSLADRDAALKKAQDELNTANQNLTKAQNDKAAIEKAKAALEIELTSKQKSAAELKVQIQAKDSAIALKEKEITSLRADAATHLAEISTLNNKIKAAEDQAIVLTGERDQLKAALAQANAANASNKAELEAQLAAKDQIVKEKEGEIAALTARLESLSSSPDIASAQAEINKLKEERDGLQAKLAQAESATQAAVQELQAAKAQIADVEGRLTGILQKSLVDVHGLWLNQDEVSSIADATCYEFVHLGADGSFAQAIACRDGRVQIQKHAFERFGAQGVTEQTDNDYVANYGFAVDGKASSSTCQDSADSVLKAGSRLVFEMTRQDFGRDYGNLVSKNMVVTGSQGFKGFSNAALNFANNRLDYEAMAAVASRPNAGALSKAAAAFLGGLQGQGTNITLGCFDANGVFTAASSN